MANNVCSSSVRESLDFPLVIDLIHRRLHSPATEPLARSVQPSYDIGEIEKSLKIVSEIRRLLDSDDPLPLENFDDAGEEIAILSKPGGRLSPSGLHRIGRILSISTAVKKFVERRRDGLPLIHEMTKPLSDFSKFVRLIESTVDSEGEILDSASSELRQVRKAVKTLENRIRKRLSEIMSGLQNEGLVQGDNPTVRNDRFVVPMKTRHKRRISGVIQDTSSTGTTTFIEPLEIIELSNRLSDTRQEEIREIERILREVTAELYPMADEIRSAFQILMEVDLQHAKGVVSREMNAEAPLVSRTGEIILRAARNPALEEVREVVPLEYDPAKENRTIVITGPNAGGKTVALKTVGLLTLMTQSGLHIPAATDSQVVAFKKIFADIGDRQSISEDLSTFTAHLQNLKTIVDNADENSLVLVDEIGTGTDPAQGAALAAAFLNEVHSRGSYTIVTTHHGSLKAIAHDTEGYCNCSMEFDGDELKPTYRFIQGVPGSSYAFEISRRLGIPDKLLDIAADYLGEEGARVETLLNDLEKERTQLDKERRLFRREKAQLDRDVAEYRQEISSVNKEAKRIKADAVREAKSIVEGANALIENAVREIKQSKAAPASVGNVRKAVRAKKEKIDSELAALEKKSTGETAPLDTGELEIGRRVIVEEFGIEGVVEELPDNRGDVALRVGSSRMRVHADMLRRAVQPQQESVKRESSYRGPESKPVSADVSLRGMRVDEAIETLDKYLDDALLAGLNTVDVIHGRGTGTLRKVVSEHLSAHPRVRGFHTAGMSDGGAGVTVVELE